MNSIRNITSYFLTIFILTIQSCKSKDETLVDEITIPRELIMQSDSLRNANDINMVVSEISTLSQLEGPYIGISGRKSEQRDYTNLLEKWADINQLVKLTDHKNAMVKSIAFAALKNKNYPGLRLIFEKHLFDRQTFQIQSGCEIFPMPINIDFYTCIYSQLNKSEAQIYKKQILRQYAGTHFEHMLPFY